MKNGWKVIFGIIGGIAVEEILRNYLRSKGEKKLQQKVTISMPQMDDTDSPVLDEHIYISKIDEGSVDLSKLQAVLIDKKESNQWKTFLSNIASEVTKTGLSLGSLDGLVKCNVPLSDLCKVKNNPRAMRGIVIEDGKISEHVELTDASVASMAPLLVYQCLAAITSQYYQQIITERLNSIDSKLGNIVKIIEAEDRAKLKVSSHRLVELSKKDTYDMGDKIIVSNILDDVEVIREKYNELLHGITPESLKSTSKATDLKEARQKIQIFTDSQFFEYLEIAMHSEALRYIALVVSIKIASYLNNEEDVKNAINQLNLEYWNEYAVKFMRIKHEVLKYLELEEDASWVNVEKITGMKKYWKAKFDSEEKKLLALQEQFNCNTTHYIRFGEGGKMVRYITQ